MKLFEVEIRCYFVIKSKDARWIVFAVGEGEIKSAHLILLLFFSGGAKQSGSSSATFFWNSNSKFACVWVAWPTH